MTEAEDGSLTPIVEGILSRGGDFDCTWMRISSFKAWIDASIKKELA